MNSKFSVQIQIQFVFVLRDTEKSELFDLVDFGDVAFWVEIVIHVRDLAFVWIGKDIGVAV